MNGNLPLDANDEDVLQKGLRRPSLVDDPLAIANSYQALQSSYDNFAPGTISKDNIWPKREVEDLREMTASQRREYLAARGVIPPESAIPDNIELPAVDQLIQNAVNDSTGNFSERLTNIQQSIDKAIKNGSNVRLDSYNQPLTGPVTQPTPLSSSPPGGSYTPPGTQPNTTDTTNVYAYTPTELYNDRYDFLTGKKLHKGIASGTGGGVGAEENSTAGTTGQSVEQQEISAVPNNVTANDTVNYDDAIQRAARANQSTPTSNAAETEQSVSSEQAPPQAENENPQNIQRASRNEIRESRRQSSQDIKEARKRGVELVRYRKPDGTYYAAPPKEYDTKKLPKRAQDMGF